MKITLEKPAIKWAASYQAMVRASVKHDGGYPYNNATLALSDFEAFVQELRDEANGVDLPEDIPIQKTYFIVLDEKVVVGELRYRPAITEPYERYNGHIGSNLHPDYRGKGYGTAATRLALDIARKNDLEGVQVTVEGHNPASVRVIEKLGGERQKQFSVKGQSISAFWIPLG